MRLNILHSPILFATFVLERSCRKQESEEAKAVRRLERLRNKYNALDNDDLHPIVINSGYRSEAVNN